MTEIIDKINEANERKLWNDIEKKYKEFLKDLYLISYHLAGKHNGDYYSDGSHYTNEITVGILLRIFPDYVDKTNEKNKKIIDGAINKIKEISKEKTIELSKTLEALVSLANQGG